MRQIKVKPTQYRRNGKIVKREGYTKNLTPKQREACKKNMAKARKKWVQMARNKRLREKIKR